jgi:uncharacterized metal-binding protein YceD (DUF177 family)
MRLHIDDLPADGRRVTLDDTARWAFDAVAAALDAEVLSLSGTVVVRPVGKGITVRGEACAVVERSCDRCLATLRQRIEGEVDLYFDSAPLEGDVNVNLHPDELDVGFVDDGILELGEALGEFFVLESPARLRCGDAAAERVEAGACELAGADGDGEPAVDPRFAALKNFRPD